MMKNRFHFIAYYQLACTPFFKPSGNSLQKNIVDATMTKMRATFGFAFALVLLFVDLPFCQFWYVPFHQNLGNETSTKYGFAAITTTDLKSEFVKNGRNKKLSIHGNVSSLLIPQRSNTLEFWIKVPVAVDSYKLIIFLTYSNPSSGFTSSSNSASSAPASSEAFFNAWNRKQKQCRIQIFLFTVAIR